MDDLVPQPFDYGTVDFDLAHKLRSAAEEIRRRMKRTSEDMLEIGRQLHAVREALPDADGSWTRWLTAEFDFDGRTARRFIAAYERFGAPEDAGQFVLAPPSVLARAAMLPDDVIDGFRRTLESGGRITNADVDTAISSERERKRQSKPLPGGHIPLFLRPRMPPLSETLEEALLPGWRRRVQKLAEDVNALAAALRFEREKHNGDSHAAGWLKDAKKRARGLDTALAALSDTPLLGAGQTLAALCGEIIAATDQPGNTTLAAWIAMLDGIGA